MHIETKVDPGFGHLGAHMKHFRGGFQGRVTPFAVEIGTAGVGPQVAARTAVGVHVRHDMAHRLGEQAGGDWIVGIGQAGDQTFHPPLGHGFARMLAGDEPQLLGRRPPVAETQNINVPPVQGLARHL